MLMFDFVRLKDRNFIKACLERDLIEEGPAGGFFARNDKACYFMGFYETAAINSDKIVIYVNGENKHMGCEGFIFKYGSVCPKITRLILFHISEFE